MHPSMITTASFWWTPALLVGPGVLRQGAVFSHAELANQASGPGEALKTLRDVTSKSSMRLRQQAGRQRG